MGNPTESTITASSGDLITVKKLALKDYATLLRCLKSLPAEIGKHFTGENKGDESESSFDRLLPNLGEIMASSITEFAQILAVVSDKDADWYENKGDLADAIDVLTAALQLNDYNRIVDSIKKLTAGQSNHPAPALK